MKRKLTATDADLLAIKLRRENMRLTHKAAMEEYKTREMIKASEKIKNHQNEFGRLLEAHSRLPLGMQGDALKRMKLVGSLLAGYRQQYPYNFPQGPYPGYNRERQIQRKST